MKRLKEYLLSALVVGIMTTLAATPRAHSTGLEEKLTSSYLMNMENKIESTYLDESSVNKSNFKYTNRLLQFPTKEIVNEKEIYMPTDLEILGLSQIIYAEAASQSNEAWSDIVQVVKNRKESKNYPNSIEDVIYQPGAFSCIDDKNNNNWNQVTGKASMNGYEKMIFNNIKEEVKYNLIKTAEPRRKNIIAYHDWSINKPNDTYWNSLIKTHEDGKLIFYEPKVKEIESSDLTYSPNTNTTLENNDIYNAPKQIIYSSSDNIIDFEKTTGLLAKATQIRKAA